ncbi:MAG: hypothetical protein KAT34_02730 [Candidatus Aminicenantes bacterium]|nr:hypothetical protein [Candidatus Aminicenantes bacterium]
MHFYCQNGKESDIKEFTTLPVIPKAPIFTISGQNDTVILSLMEEF